VGDVVVADGDVVWEEGISILLLPSSGRRKPSDPMQTEAFIRKIHIVTTRLATWVA